MRSIDEIIQGSENRLKYRVINFLISVNRMKLVKKIEEDWPFDIDDQIDLSVKILKQSEMVY